MILIKLLGIRNFVLNSLLALANVCIFFYQRKHETIKQWDTVRRKE